MPNNLKTIFQFELLSRLYTCTLLIEHWIIPIHFISLVTRKLWNVSTQASVISPMFFEEYKCVDLNLIFTIYHNAY